MSQYDPAFTPINTEMDHIISPAMRKAYGIQDPDWEWTKHLLFSERDKIIALFQKDAERIRQFKANKT